ncbi:hypothetical protein K8R32_02955, partial [bacterium]|nr:hypothetical protein [bacterium]
MRLFLKTILKFYLKYITKLVLFIHRPTIIAVAGSINKPFVKESIKSVLEEAGLSVRANPKNFNTDIGLPLAVLYLKSGYNSYRNWLPIIARAPLAIFSKNFPNFLVLGLGTSDPGDMRYLLSVVKPKIAVITDITQRYLDSFRDMDLLIKEYEILARIIPKDGLLLINNDNERIKKLGSISKARVESFAINAEADWRASKSKKEATGQSAKIKHNN